MSISNKHSEKWKTDNYSTVKARQKGSIRSRRRINKFLEVVKIKEIKENETK